MFGTQEAEYLVFILQANKVTIRSHKIDAIKY